MAALAAIQKRAPEVTSLRAATMEQLDAVKADVSDEVYRRARHVIGECGRCLDAAAAFEASAGLDLDSSESATMLAELLRE